MFKKTLRPTLVAVTECVSAASWRSWKACPSCQLSTRARSHPIHSTARVTLGHNETPRKDQVFRKEFYGTGGYPVHKPTTYGEYTERRSNGRTEATVPSILLKFSQMVEAGELPNREGYIALLLLAAEYSIARSGTDARILPPGVSGDAEHGVMRSFVDKENREVWKAMGETGLGWKIAWCAWEDARRGGVKLGIEGFEILLRAAVPHPHLLNSLLLHAQTSPLNTFRNTITYNFAFALPLVQKNLEQCLVLLSELRRRGLNVPKGRTAQVIKVACEVGEMRIAMELAERAEREEPKGVEVESWIDILRCSAENQFYEGIEVAWSKTVALGKFIPDEGLCILLLNVCGRHGKPDLATAVLTIFQQLGISAREHHLAPLLEAFCRDKIGRLADAFEVLDVMRTTSGMNPTLKTAQPIVNIISDDAKSLDTAFYAVESMKLSGKRIDISAFNALVRAAELLGDLKRAVVIYGQANALGVRPNAETYHCLLGVCLATQARSTADIILKDMASPKLLPSEPLDSPAPLPIPLDITSYSYLIQLCLTQESYEDAFFYLEQMKSDSLRPPLEVYDAFVRKCVKVGDMRYKLVLEEMQAGGYKPRRDLLVYVQRTLDVRDGVWEERGDAGKGRKEFTKERSLPPGKGVGGFGGSGKKRGTRGEGGPRREGVAARER